MEHVSSIGWTRPYTSAHPYKPRTRGHHPICRSWPAVSHCPGVRRARHFYRNPLSPDLTPQCGASADRFDGLSATAAARTRTSLTGGDSGHVLLVHRKGVTDAADKLFEDVGVGARELLANAVLAFHRVGDSVGPPAIFETHCRRLAPVPLERAISRT